MPRHKSPRGPMLMPRRVASKISEEGQAVIDQLICARHRAGMTQQQVADEIGGLSSANIADIECGRHRNGPSITRLVQYARAVGLDIIRIPEE
jgi:DNA-binding XRE family transcriptional regulator